MIELVIVVAILGLLAGIALPGVIGGIRRTGVDGAARRLSEDIRLAQSNAITRGLQCRLLSFDDSGVAQIKSASGTVTTVTDATKKNRYRLETRTSGCVAGDTWPSLAASAAQGAVAVSGSCSVEALTEWHDVGSGVRITGSNALVFNSLGSLYNSTTALQIVLQGSAGTKTVQTSIIGKATTL
jgi:type II secretory pathway pseudopilin PulG